MADFDIDLCPLWCNANSLKMNDIHNLRDFVSYFVVFTIFDVKISDGFEEQTWLQVSLNLWQVLPPTANICLDVYLRC